MYPPVCTCVCVCVCTWCVWVCGYMQQVILLVTDIFELLQLGTLTLLCYGGQLLHELPRETEREREEREREGEETERP